MEALAICFASSGVVLMLALYFILRSSGSQVEAETPAKEPETRPMDFETLRLEGYQILDIYDDAEYWREGLAGPRGLTSERVVRTAKVRDPETGQVTLVKVQTVVKPW